MKCIVITIIFVIFGPYFSSANWCIHNTTKHIQITRPLTRITTFRTWFGKKRQKIESYRITELVPQIKQHRVCCEGYALNRTQKTCEPYCPQGCPQFSECSKPNTCECQNGFRMIKERCEPICEPFCDVNASCSAPNICVCNYGFYKKSFGDMCEPWCKDNCDNGQCIGIGKCSCKENFVKIDGICVPDCKISCKFGKCSKDGLCECLNGFEYKKSTGTCELSSNEESTTTDDILTKAHTTGLKVSSEDTSRTLKISSTEIEITTPRSIGSINILTDCKQHCWLGRCSKNGMCECWSGNDYFKSILECDQNHEMTGSTPEEEYTETIPEDNSKSAEKMFTSSIRETQAETDTITSSSNIIYQESNPYKGPYSTQSSESSEHTSWSEPSDVSSLKSSENFDSCDNGCWAGKCINKVCQCPIGLYFNRYLNDCSIVCDKVCNNGVCDENRVCQCFNGYVHQNSTECVPNCDKKCINSICVAPRKCECLDGFVHRSDNWFECVPIWKLAEQQKRKNTSFNWIWIILAVMSIATIGLFTFRNLRKETYNVGKIEKTRHAMQVQFNNKDEQFV